MIETKSRTVALSEVVHRIMQYHFTVSSWRMSSGSFESECSDYDRSDIVCAQGDYAQRLSVPRKVSTIDQLGIRDVSLAFNPVLAKRALLELNDGCEFRSQPSLHEGVLSQEDAKCIYEVFCQGKSHSRISLEELRLESVAVNARRDASTSAVPLSYLSISNRINMLCTAGGNDAFSLSFPLGNSNCAVDRAQSIIEMASRAGLCAQIKDADQECMAVPPHVLSQILELLLVKICASDGYRRYCAEKLAGLSIVDEPSFCYGESHEGSLFDGYGVPILAAVVTDEAFNPKSPFGKIGQSDLNPQVPGRSFAMIRDVPFGVPGWVNLQISRPDADLPSPKMRVIAASSVMPQPTVDKALLVALVENCDNECLPYEICTLSFSITELLLHAEIEDSFSRANHRTL